MAEEPLQTRRAIVAGAIGNIMEWYDFAVYGFFAAILGRQFFPAEDPLSSLLAAFGVFAAGYLMRPFGSLVFGHIGDRVGRKAALTLSVAAMAVPTFLIGLLPTHAEIGAAAIGTESQAFRYFPSQSSVCCQASLAAASS